MESIKIKKVRELIEVPENRKVIAGISSSNRCGRESSIKDARPV